MESPMNKIKAKTATFRGRGLVISEFSEKVMFQIARSRLAASGANRRK